MLSLMAIFQGLFFLLIGVVLVVVAGESWPARPRERLVSPWRATPHPN
jgi:hypothetical protein